MKQFDSRGVVNSNLSFTFPQALYPVLWQQTLFLTRWGPFGYKRECPSCPYIEQDSSPLDANRWRLPLFAPQDARPSEQETIILHTAVVYLSPVYS